MKVTIIADASFCPHTRVAGYGFWIASVRGKRPGQGVLAELVRDNVVAEMRAIAIALHAAVLDRLVLPFDEVLLQTDCQAAISAFTGLRTVLNTEEAATVAFMQQFATAHALVLTYRHVKGHSYLTDPRYRSNNACDRRAKTAMRAARDAIQRAQSTTEQEIEDEQ